MPASCTVLRPEWVLSVETKSAKNMKAFLRDLSLFQIRGLAGISSRSPEPLRKVFQLILSIAFGIGQLR